MFGYFFNEKSLFNSFRSIPPTVEIASSISRNDSILIVRDLTFLIKDSFDKNSSFVEKLLIMDSCSLFRLKIAT